MRLSIAAIIVIGYIIFSETQEQMQKRLKKAGEIYFIKTLPTPARWIVYLLNSGIALYNALTLTGISEWILAATLLLSTNVVVNIAKVVIDKEHIFIGNTKLKHEAFKLVSLEKQTEKQSKMVFDMTIRKRVMRKDLYIPTSQLAELDNALVQIGAKAATKAKGGKVKKK